MASRTIVAKDNNFLARTCNSQAANFSKQVLGKGSKIKLIIFAEFSANGGGVPPIRENN